VQAWKANVVRIPLNEASWLDYTCVDTNGKTINPDPGNNYKSAVESQVAAANAAGLYVILDLHWTAPGNSCPELQTEMADADHSLAFWTSIANTFKNNPAVIFELFNEPYFDPANFSGNEWSYMMNGTGGAFSGFPATSVNGNRKNISMAWKIASFQDMINAVRATGATNVVLVGNQNYSSDLSQWVQYMPNDPLKQMGATWHPYPDSNKGIMYAYPNYYPAVFTYAQQILAANVPLVATEFGGQNSAGTPNCPICTTMENFADANGMSLVGWTWDVWGAADFDLIQDVNGTPTPGYGVTFKSWMVNHP
jgi:aryl-phospho-beta-D-glucosidase BglC (GH1 family)